MLSQLGRSLWVAAMWLALVPTPLTASGKKPADPVDINRASVAELMQVQGMTAVWAARIVRFRPYRTKLDLLEKGVVSPDAYQRIRDGIVAHRDVVKQ